MLYAVMNESPIAYVELSGAPHPSADDAFVDFLRAELPRLQHLARLLCGVSGADDLLAEAVARTLPKWRAGAVREPRPYLRRVMVNLVIRRSRLQALSLRRDGAALEWTQADSDFTGSVSDRQRTLGALAQLPARRRAIVALRFYEDLSEVQIARVLDIKVGTVKSQLSRALAQLRVDLEGVETR